jgi:trimethylamine:corrinoid methyltransferase-like protein
MASFRTTGMPASADSLIIDANQLSGSTATFTNINIGQDASTLDQVSGVPVGQAGTFGQQADSVAITDLHQTAYSTSAGTFTLPGFSLSLSAGDSPCF